MPTSAPILRPFPDCPLLSLTVSASDSTAMLIEFAKRGIRPDHILFADTAARSQKLQSIST